jgi:hypothetical protein
LRIRVVTPADVTLARGNRLTRAAAPDPGATGRFRYEVRIPPGLPRRIYVRAELVTREGRVWTRGENLALLAGSPLHPEPAPRLVPDGRGGSLVEFDGAAVTAPGAAGKRP